MRNPNWRSEFLSTLFPLSMLKKQVQGQISEANSVTVFTSLLIWGYFTSFHASTLLFWLFFFFFFQEDSSFVLFAEICFVLNVHSFKNSLLACNLHIRNDSVNTHCKQFSQRLYTVDSPQILLSNCKAQRLILKYPRYTCKHEHFLKYRIYLVLGCYKYVV